MTDTSNRAHRDLWQIQSYEMTLWAALLVLLCVGVLWQHGGTGLSASSVSVQRVDVADARPLDTPAWRMDVNSATAAELVLLPGIGPRRAANIVAERRKRGGFHSIWELCEVPGLTKAMVRRLEPLVQTKNAPAQPAPSVAK